VASRPYRAGRPGSTAGPGRVRRRNWSGRPWPRPARKPSRGAPTGARPRARRNSTAIVDATSGAVV